MMRTHSKAAVAQNLYFLTLVVAKANRHRDKKNCRTLQHLLVQEAPPANLSHLEFQTMNNLKIQEFQTPIQLKGKGLGLGEFYRISR